MVIQKFHGAIPKTTLAVSISSGDVTLQLSSGTGWTVAVPFVITIERGTANEERIKVGAASGTTLSSLTRGYDGTTARAHTGGATCYIEHTLDATFVAKVATLVDAPATKGDIPVWNGTGWTVMPAPTNGQTLIAASGESDGWSSQALSFLASAAGAGSIPVGLAGTYQEKTLPANVGHHGVLSSPAGIVNWKGEPLVIDTTANIATARALAAHQYAGQAFADTTKKALLVDRGGGTLEEVMGWPQAVSMEWGTVGGELVSGSSSYQGAFGTSTPTNVWEMTVQNNPRSIATAVGPSSRYVLDLNGLAGWWMLSFSCLSSHFAVAMNIHAEESAAAASGYGYVKGGASIKHPIDDNGFNVCAMFPVTLRYLSISLGCLASGGTPDFTQPCLQLYRLPGTWG